MDERIHKQAEILVNHSANIKQGDFVVVSASPESTDLVEAVYQELGKVGAVPHLIMNHSEASSRYYDEIEMDQIIESEHKKELWRKTDSAINIRGSKNTKSTGGIDPEIRSKTSNVNKEIQEIRLDTKWVVTQHPTSGNAQEAEMSQRKYEDFVYDCIIRDWDEQKEFQSNMVELLDTGDEVRIVSGDNTDIKMSINGMNPINDYGEHNMPGGEVFTAPVVDSVQGSVLFDMPLITQGREVRDVYLKFENGEVVDYNASKNKELIGSLLETDEGSSRLGELGIGMNRGIDKFTYNMLFDEKMGDTVHMALGRAYEDNVGEERKRNQSARHVDMIVDMSEDSYIEVDGEKVQENGKFVFEE